MLEAEARWFGQMMKRYEAELFPLCNLGSGSGAYRREVQPWISRWLFPPEVGPVVHVDQQAEPGVDLVGDVHDAAFFSQLATQGFASVMCANMLEHVADPADTARLILELVPPGGLLFLSVPRSFPYHPDPIDTLYRPTPTELASLFTGTQIEAQAIIPCGTLASFRRLRHPISLLRSLTTRSRPQISSKPSPSRLRYLPWLVRRFEVSCLVLRKQP